MELSAEERKRIYEEEKARIESEPVSRKPRWKENDELDETTRPQRITASSIAIVWCIALLVLFYGFRQYLAYYQIQSTNGVIQWVRFEILTADFNHWLPVLTAVLILSIIGHILAIIYDTYIIRKSIVVFLNILAIGVIAYLLYLSPFNFSTIPEDGQVIFSIIVKASIIIVLVILCIVTLTNLIRLVVRVLTGTANYEYH